MISIIITSFKEPETIGRAISSILKNKIKEKHEIIVCAPDNETLGAASGYRKKIKDIKLLKDPGRGKPAALNLAVSKSSGDVIILTDGDVFVDNYALNPLIEILKRDDVGAVSGRPVSINQRDNKFGFWAFALTEVANEWRIKAEKSNKKFFCSGYLFAIRKKLFPKLPENLLSEDGFISNKVYDSGFAIKYSESSKVYVKYPDNFSDWLSQKKRSAGGYRQIRKMLGKSVRSFAFESSGAGLFFRFVTSSKEFIWLMELFIARVYLWSLIFAGKNLRGKEGGKGWMRIESTK